MSRRLLRVVVSVVAIMAIAGAMSGFAASNTVEPTRLGVEEVPYPIVLPFLPG